MDDWAARIVAFAFIGGVIGLIIGVIKWAIGASQRSQVTQRQTLIEAQGWVEARSIELIREFPEHSDAAIVQLIHDELANYRIQEPVYFHYTNANTIGRVRRTLELAVVRAQR